MFDRTPAFDLEYKDGATESAVPRYYIKARELDGKELVKERRHQVPELRNLLIRPESRGDTCLSI